LRRGKSQLLQSGEAIGGSVVDHALSLAGCISKLAQNTALVPTHAILMAKFLRPGDWFSLGIHLGILGVDLGAGPGLGLAEVIEFSLGGSVVRTILPGRFYGFSKPTFNTGLARTRRWRGPSPAPFRYALLT
jgi:hypothetical protein